MRTINRIVVFICLLGGLLAAPDLAYAQDIQVQRATKTVTIGSKQFYMHHVKAGETLYAISKAYQVSQDEILNFNPDVKTHGLQAGMVIGVPAEEEKSQASEAEVAKPVEVSKPVEVVKPVEENKPVEVVKPVEEPKKEVVEPALKTIEDTIVEIGGKRYVMHYVKPGETVWGLSHAFHVTEEQILSKNPEVKDGLKAGMVIGIPVLEEEKNDEEQVSHNVTAGSDEEKESSIEAGNQENEGQGRVIPPVSDDDEYFDGYVIHTVKKAEKTKTLARDWNVSLEEFRQLNPSVGSRVFVGQKVLIPYHPSQGDDATQEHLAEEKPVVDEPIVENPVTEPSGDVAADVSTEPQTAPETEPENPSGNLIYSTEKPLDCYIAKSNAERTFRVALMVPLYLDEVDKVDTSRERAEKTKKSRSMRFLQFYEGFMMAVDSLTAHEGLRLNLSVMDVTENTAGAEAAVEKLRGQEVDLIVGPFFSKSFAVVQEYAATQGIMIVNPLSERESVVADAPNVLKLKPGKQSMVTELRDLLRIRYPKAKVTLMTPSNVKDSTMVQALEQMLTQAVPQEVQLTNTEMVELITRESQRRKMGKRVLSNLEVEGQIFSTKALEARPNEVTVFQNPFRHITYSDSEIKSFKEGLSSARENVLIAYGEDLVFATKILNNINKSAGSYPITLIGLPQWSDFENLLVQNLLNMNAIYFDDHFVNYNDSAVLQFVDDFRSKYESEPDVYAFEGFDVGWYFLKALMAYGPHPMDCLPYYHLPQLHSSYYFNKSRMRDGLENRYWNIYQYDSQSVELKPVMIYSEREE